VPDHRTIASGRHHIPPVAADRATIRKDAVLARPCVPTRETFAVTQRARLNRRRANARTVHGALLSNRRCAVGGFRYSVRNQRATTNGRAGVSGPSSTRLAAYIPAGLLAALNAVAQSIERVLHNNEVLADVLRAGRRVLGEGRI
jgi:hypothetical protein